MTTDNHTPIATNAAGNSAVVNAPLAQLDAVIGNPALMGTTIRTNLAHALGYALLRTPETNTLTGAVNSVYDLVVAAQAELDEASGGYASLDARLDAFIMAGGNVATKANGVSAAGQKVLTVDSTDGFVVNAYVTYLLNGTTLEGNTIGSIQAGVSLTLGTNIGAAPAGGVLDDSYVSMISVSEYQAAQAIPHAGTLLLPQTMEYVNGGVFNVRAYGATGNGATDDTAAIQAACTAASTAGAGSVFLPAGNYKITAPLTIVATARGLEICGAGYSEGGTGTIITYTGTDPMISATSLSMFRMKDLFWSGGASAGPMLALTYSVFIQLTNFGFIQQNPAKEWVKFDNTVAFLLIDTVQGRHEGNTVPTISVINTSSSHNFFNIVMENLYLNGSVAGTSPMIVVADNSNNARQSMGPVLRNCVFEIPGGGAIQIVSQRNSLLDTITVADVLATPANPIVEYKHYGATSNYTWGHTILNCNFLGGDGTKPDVKIENHAQMRDFIIQSSRIGYFESESYAYVTVLNSTIDHLVGTTAFQSPLMLLAGSSAAATTLGSVNRKIRVMDEEGNYGYIALYDAITGP